MDYVLDICKALGSKPSTKKKMKICVFGIIRNLYERMRLDWILGKNAIKQRPSSTRLVKKGRHGPKEF